MRTAVDDRFQLTSEQTGSDEMPRRSLLARFNRARPRIIALMAPAGYGKSTLTRQYAASYPKQAICDLSSVTEESDCARAIVMALADESPERSESLISLELQLHDVDVKAASEIVLSAWNARIDGSIFVFDNAERLAEIGLEESLARFLTASPRGRTIVISSRKPLRLRLSRFAAPHEIVTLRAADLAFDADEIAALAGTESDAKAIAAISYGWPVAVLLLARLAREPDFDRLLTRLDDVVFEDLYEYLSVEVLATLEPKLAEALATIACIPDATDHDLAALGMDTLVEMPPFLRRSSNGRYALLPLLQRALLASKPDLTARVLSTLAQAHLHGESYLRAAQVAMAAGNEDDAARALDRIDVWERLPEREFAQTLAKIDSTIVAEYPKLWFFWAERRKYSVDPGTALAETRVMWQRLPPGVAHSTRAAIFDKLVNRMLRLGFIDAAIELVDEQNEQFGARELPQSVEAADVVLMRSIIAARFGRFAERARLIEAIERGIGFTEIMLLRERLERAVHVERVRSNYAVECNLLDTLVKDSERAGLSEWSAQALGHAVFGAWFAGDRSRAASLAEHFAALVRKHSFTGLEHFAECALGRTDARPRGIEAYVWLAQAHLIAWQQSTDSSVARYHANAARESADAWGNPFLRILARVALAQLEPDGNAQLYAEASALAEPMESAALHEALHAMQSGSDLCGMLEPLVVRAADQERTTERSTLVVAVLSLQVTCRGIAVTIPDRELQLVVALALRREGLRREELCELLWPDLSSEAARVALKSCTYRLRSRLGEYNAIVASQSMLRLGTGATVDLWEIADAVAEWRTGDETSQSTLAKLSATRVRLSSIFAPQLLRWDWLADRMRALSELRIELAAQLAEAALARRDAAEALELAREIEAYDSTDELGCSLAIRALRFSGDEVGADRTYRRYCEVLRRELDIEPSAALERLYRANDRDGSVASVR